MAKKARKPRVGARLVFIDESAAATQSPGQATVHPEADANLFCSNQQLPGSVSRLNASRWSP
jgi:hypothetical protein